MRAFRYMPQNLWEQPVDLEWLTDYCGEILVPFPRHIAGPLAQQSAASNLHRFASLPAEIGSMIVASCDAPTLWQLMRTSSAMRREASRLFYEDDKAWYRVDGDWLRVGGYSGETVDDIEFMSNIKRLNVHFACMSSENWTTEQHAFGACCMPHLEQKADRVGSILHRVYHFWQTLRSRFPCATHVILSDALRNDERSMRRHIYRTICRASPREICATYIFHNEDKVWLNEPEPLMQTWQDVPLVSETGSEVRWELVPFTRQKFIQIPHKTFRGPLGAFQKAFVMLNTWHGQLRTAALHFIFMDRQHFHGRHQPFSCYADGCGAAFDQLGQYTLHVCESGHDDRLELPKNIQEMFDANEIRLQKLLHDFHNIFDSLYESWGSEGSEQRRIAQSTYLCQMKSDMLYTQVRDGQHKRVLDDIEQAMLEHRAHLPGGCYYHDRDDGQVKSSAQVNDEQ